MSIANPANIASYLQLGGRETPRQEAAGIYVHFPFCRHICTYCDFDKFAGMEGMIESYMDAVVSQVLASPMARASSLYVGGGTPSMMSPGQAARLVAACQDRFGLASGSEATIEANPSGLGPDKLAGFRSAGFNRLSIGVQSTDDRLLRLLGRRHRADDARDTVATAREAGFENVSVDLIYGVPMQTPRIWRETLETVVDWGIDHLSCYMLTVEEGTPLERGVTRGTLQLPPEDDIVSMYEDATTLLDGAGYHRYEISNWARPGCESSHNLTYWRNEPYLAIGAGAAGSWQGRRYKILPDVPRYIRGVGEGRVALPRMS